MSISDLQAFLGKVAKDEALRDQLHAASGLDAVDLYQALTTAWSLYGP